VIAQLNLNIIVRNVISRDARVLILATVDYSCYVWLSRVL